MDRKEFLKSVGAGTLGIASIGAFGMAVAKDPESKIEGRARHTDLEVSEWSWEVLKEMLAGDSRGEKYMSGSKLWVDKKATIRWVGCPEPNSCVLRVTLSTVDYYVDEMELLSAADKIASVWVCETANNDPIEVSCGWRFNVGDESEGFVEVWAKVVDYLS